MVYLMVKPNHLLNKGNSSSLLGTELGIPVCLHDICKCGGSIVCISRHVAIGKCWHRQARELTRFVLPMVVFHNPCLMFCSDGICIRHEDYDIRQVMYAHSAFLSCLRSENADKLALHDG